MGHGATTFLTGSDPAELSPTGAVLGTFPVGSDPGGIAFDGTHTWAASDSGGMGLVTEL